MVSAIKGVGLPFVCTIVHVVTGGFPNVDREEGEFFDFGWCLFAHRRRQSQSVSLFFRFFKLLNYGRTIR